MEPINSSVTDAIQGCLRLERMAFSQQFHDQEHADEYKGRSGLADLHDSLVAEARTRRRMLLDRIFMLDQLPDPKPEIGDQATFDVVQELENTRGLLDALCRAWQNVFTAAKNANSPYDMDMAAVSLHGGQWSKKRGKKTVEVRGLIQWVCEIEVLQGKLKDQGYNVFMATEA